jgi:CheY-like chemotaxis protein
MSDMLKNKILVVEDNLEICLLYSRLLQKHGFNVAVSYNGAEALRIIPNYKPDLIITDLMMPVMDGVEMLQKLREDPETRHLPAIITSAAWDWAQEYRELWQSFIGKPANLKQLILTIDKLISTQDGPEDKL